MNRLIRVYAALLRLYPHRFRAEFGDEMQSVFAHAVNDAARRGLVAVARVRARSVGTASTRWPVSIGRVSGGEMSAIPDTREAAARRRAIERFVPAALATALPFLVCGLTMVLERTVTPDMYGRTGLRSRRCSSG
jgi:hypothetical protein